MMRGGAGCVPGTLRSASCTGLTHPAQLISTSSSTATPVDCWTMVHLQRCATEGPQAPELRAVVPVHDRLTDEIGPKPAPLPHLRDPADFVQEPFVALARLDGTISLRGERLLSVAWAGAVPVWGARAHMGRGTFGECVVPGGGGAHEVARVRSSVGGPVSVCQACLHSSSLSECDHSGVFATQKEVSLISYGSRSHTEQPRHCRGGELVYARVFSTCGAAPPRACASQARGARPCPAGYCAAASSRSAQCRQPVQNTLPGTRETVFEQPSF
jgi:hypothetical protein